MNITADINTDIEKFWKNFGRVVTFGTTGIEWIFTDIGHRSVSFMSYKYLKKYL